MAGAIAALPGAGGGGEDKAEVARHGTAIERWWCAVCGQALQIAKRGDGESGRPASGGCRGASPPKEGTMGILGRLGLRRVAAVAAPSPGGKVVRVGPGETLRTIAKLGYGDEAAWERIYAANMVHVTDAEAPEIGTELRLP